MVRGDEERKRLLALLKMLLGSIEEIERGANEGEESENEEWNGGERFRWIRWWAGAAFSSLSHPTGLFAGHEREVGDEL